MSSKLFKKVKAYLSGRKNISGEKELLKKIEYGFKNDEFKMHLQFIVDNKTKKLALAEALSRWEKALGEVIFPGDYIGVMEKSGLIVKFDYYMFEMVCKKLSEWKNTNMDSVAISCNFTRITISEKDFLGKIKEIADKYSFDRNKLIIEITEDSIEKNLDVAKSNIINTKELGFTIALDDIGSGYATLENFCDYPVDIIKIDRKILLQTQTETGKEQYLGIIAKAHALNLKTVCEGVETEEQNEFVTESECDYIQGWYYSKALPQLKAEEFFSEYMNKF